MAVCASRSERSTLARTVQIDMTSSDEDVHRLDGDSFRELQRKARHVAVGPPRSRPSHQRNPADSETKTKSAAVTLIPIPTPRPAYRNCRSVYDLTLHRDCAKYNARNMLTVSIRPQP